MALNVIALMGRLTHVPELRSTPNGISTVTFTIACDRSYAKPGGERQTDFIDVVAWRGTAEFVCKYFQKGSMMAVDGSLQTRTYEDKEGKKRKVCEVVASNVHFAESKQGNGKPPAANNKAASGDDFTVIDDSEDLPF